MNTFDKFVIENLKFVKNEFVAVIFAFIILFLLAKVDLFFNPGMSIVIIITFLVAIIPFYFIYKKIFYDTVFGKSAMLFNQLPVTKKEIVAGKILTVSVIYVAIEIVTLLGTKFTGNNVFEGVEGALAFESTLDIVKNLVASAATGAICFFAVSFYNGITKNLRTRVRFIKAVVIFLIVQALNMRAGMEMCRILNIENPVYGSLLSIVISLVILIVCAHGTLRFLEKSEAF